MNNKFARVYPAVVTPFNEDGTFCFAAAKKHADWMLSEGLIKAFLWKNIRHMSVKCFLT